MKPYKVTVVLTTVLDADSQASALNQVLEHAGDVELGPKGAALPMQLQGIRATRWHESREPRP